MSVNTTAREGIPPATGTPGSDSSALFPAVLISLVASLHSCDAYGVCVCVCVFIVAHVCMCVHMCVYVCGGWGGGGGGCGRERERGGEIRRELTK